MRLIDLLNVLFVTEQVEIVDTETYKTIYKGYVDKVPWILTERKVKAVCSNYIKSSDMYVYIIIKI